MMGGLMKTTSRLAVVAAAGLFMGGAAYAGGSIGGDCCADLEERVAELEATTARKGNRKVSLTVYGQVNKAVLFSGEGRDDLDTQIIDNNLSGSRFGLKGKAKISSDLYAGYKLEFYVGHTGENDADDDWFALRHNDLYIGSKTFGKLSIGHGSTASDGITEIDLSGTTVAGGTTNLAGEYTTGWDFDNLDGDSRRERVRYDSPTLVGFKVSASWQENEDFDVALRYGATLGDFTVAAGIAYLNEEDTVDEETVSGSVSVKHVPTGLSLTFAGGREEEASSGDLNLEYWYVKGGIQRKIFAAGSTAFSVDYHSQENGAGYEADKVGFQLVQKIDAAAMELYLAGWSSESEDGFREEDALMIGSRIKF